MWQAVSSSGVFMTKIEADHTSWGVPVDVKLCLSGGEVLSSTGLPRLVSHLCTIMSALKTNGAFSVHKILTLTMINEDRTVAYVSGKTQIKTI